MSSQESDLPTYICHPVPGLPCDLRDGGIEFDGMALKKAINNIESQLSAAITGLNPSDQRAVDEALKNMDDTESKTDMGANALLGSSMAIALAGAKIRGCTLFEHIRRTYDLPHSENTSLPVPIFRFLEPSTGAKSGKLRIRGVYAVFSNHVKRSHVLTKGLALSHQLSVLFSQKFGASSAHTSAEGSFCINLDKIEQCIDFLREAAQSVPNLEFERDIRVGLDIGANSCWDEGKQKYEIVQGMAKSTQDMIEYYKDIVMSHPAIAFIEDPFRNEDKDSSAELQSSIGIRCNVVGSDIYFSRAELILAGRENGQTGLARVNLSHATCLSDLIGSCSNAKSVKHDVILTDRSSSFSSEIIHIVSSFDAIIEGLELFSCNALTHFL